MKAVLKWWHQQNIPSTINALTQINDLSVLNDFMSDKFADNKKLEVLTIENAPALIGHCLTLVNSKYEAHTHTGVKSYGNIFNVFRDVSIPYCKIFLANNASEIYYCQ
jgi:con80 domain of Katanin